MDPISLVGALLILIGVFVGALLKGVSPVAFFTVPAAFLIVVLPTFGAAFLGTTTSDAKNLPRLFKMMFRKGEGEDGDVVPTIVGLGERARRDGLLSLESELDQLEDPFLRKGLQMVVDGADPEIVEEVLDSEIRAMSSRHRQGAKMITSMGTYSPTFGIIGAVVGLIVTLGKLDNPSELGHGIAAAFIATFWGVFLANGIFLPWAAKLGRLSALEVARKRMLVEAVLGIQSGFNPRVLGDLVRSHLPPSRASSTAEPERSSA
ncbi:motility protein A [Dermatobacter hominis]|uniref:motility protein A n=1 Tax=Dermatobacter hominis TaxID=2884263 RepID=UPI001D0FC947|nr:motility protein A [Dermatobacter hominis]UDY37189.1 motility protein A [Dermatobacter hominis]